jgi:hypothetical protein
MGGHATDRHGLIDMTALGADISSLAVDGEGWRSSSNSVKVGFPRMKERGDLVASDSVGGHWGLTLFYRGGGAGRVLHGISCGKRKWYLMR